MKNFTTIILFFILCDVYATRVPAKLIDAKGEAYAVQLKIRVNLFTNEIDCIPLQKKIVFYNDFDKKFKLKAHQVKSIEFNYGGESYFLISVNNSLTYSSSGKILLRLMQDGYLKRYYFYEKRSSGGYMGANGMMVGGSTVTIKTDVLQKGVGSLYRVRKLRFKKEMSSYLSDYPELADKISNKELRIGSLPYIIDNYNQWYLEKGTNK